LDTTDAISINGSDSEVAVFTPVSGPGVLDEVVFDAPFGSVADSGNSMIKLGTA